MVRFMARGVKTKPISPARTVLAKALTTAEQKRWSTWRQFEPTYLSAMQKFDQLVASGQTTDGDRRNGKGDAFNDFLVTLLQECSGKTLHTRPDVPGLSFRRHKLDIAYPDRPKPVEFVVETKAAGIPLHPANTSQPHSGGRAGSADLEKRVKEASLKNIDIKAEAARLMGKGGGPTSDLGSWMRSAKPLCYMLMAVRIRDAGDLAATIRFGEIASVWFDRCGIYCYGWNKANTAYEAKPVPVTLELDRVLAEICTALRNLP
jgi:hypothetical protein